MKKLFAFVAVLTLSLVSVVPAFAHVVVKPSQVLTGVFQTFTIGVPNEKEVPVTELKLIIPEGLNHVTPNVKDGWDITSVKTNEGEDAKVTEINWSGGKVPAGFRDEFLFSAQVPADETELTWKAYQTYENGDVVSWDQKGESETEGSNSGPASITKVVLDNKDATGSVNNQQNTTGSVSVILSALALAVSAIAFVAARRSFSVKT